MNTEMNRSDLERHLDDLAAACKNEIDRVAFLKPFFPKLFLALDTTLGQAILNEILRRANLGSKANAVPSQPIPKKSSHSFESEDFRKSLRKSRLRTPDDGYWG